LQVLKEFLNASRDLIHSIAFGRLLIVSFEKELSKRLDIEGDTIFMVTQFGGGDIFLTWAFFPNANR